MDRGRDERVRGGEERVWRRGGGRDVESEGRREGRERQEEIREE